MGIFPNGVSVITLVTTRTMECGKVIVGRKIRTTKGDMRLHFPMGPDGPVLGRNVFRELTLKELCERRGLTEGQASALRRENYLATLVSVCTTGDWLTLTAG